MKIAILHIGDLHVIDRKSISQVHIHKIVDTLNSVPKFDELLIIIAGDIAYSGRKEEYQFAYYLIGQLISKIRKFQDFHLSIQVMCVPGNHDLDHKGKPRTSLELQEIRKNNQYESFLQGELKKQECFFNFAKSNKCFADKTVFEKKRLSFEGCIIEVNLINSGVFSILEEDKGLHYIPSSVIKSLSSDSTADFTFTIMHHSPEWYTDEIKNELEDAIYKNSSVVFFGHEHYIRGKNVGFEKEPATIVQAGGCLCKNDDWSMSAFHLAILDTAAREYLHTEYKWNCRNKQYEPITTPCSDIIKQKNNFDFDAAFLKDILTDAKHEITADFREYYVFPRIRAEERINGNSREVNEEDAFINEIVEKKKVLVTGGYNFGKTTLLKKLFLSFFELGYLPVLCSVELIKGKKASRAIKNAFEDCYGEAPELYTKFTQMPKEKRVVLIDDIDLIKNSSFESLLAQLGEYFDIIVLSSRQMIDVSLFDRMKEQLKTSDTIYRYSLLPFYADKRRELVKKVVSIKVSDQNAAEKTADRLAEAITIKRHLVIPEPDYIIRFVECYCNNVGEMSDADSNVFSKVFEASLTNAIGASIRKRLTVDLVFVVLSKIAYYIHFEQKYPISEKDIISIIDKYNEVYGANVTAVDFIKVVTDAKILLLDEKTVAYRFASNSQLAYFVAREVNSQYHQNGNDEDIKKILRLACFGINADILLFISYITDNVRILRLILEAAVENAKEWNEFDFRDNLPNFLKEQRQHFVSIPAPDALSEEDQAIVMTEKEEEPILTSDIYDYCEDDADQFINQFIRGVQLLTIVARSLPGFEHSMLKSDKEKFVNAIYTLPNKTFNAWAIEADKEVDEIIAFFKSQSQDYFAREKKVSDEDLMMALQWSAMSLLLDLYHLPVIYAARENTMSYLSSFDYSKQETYSLEHLMMLERQAGSGTFISVATKLIDSAAGKNNLLFSAMIKRVVRHSLVFRKDFDYSQRQQLQSKFFPGANLNKEILIQRLQSAEEQIR